MKRSPRLRAALMGVAFILAALTVLGIAACGSGDDPGVTGPDAPDGDSPPTTAEGTTAPGPNGAQFALARSDLSRAAPSASETEIRSAAQAMESFGVDLYHLLGEQAGQGNLVFSPASIITALAMTYAGAAGTTAEEMAATLHFAVPEEALHRAFNSLDALVESRSWEGKDEDGRDVGVLVRTANSLWAQYDSVFQRPFLDAIAANYGAGVRLVDYKTAAEAARMAINAWVSEETEDKIPNLLAEGTLDALTRLVLVNAVYLDATWSMQFDPEATVEAPFTTLEGSTTTVDMMRQSALHAYGKGDGWQAVELPYMRDELSMLLIVPDQGRFAEVESRLSEGLVSQALSSLSREAEVILGLPKFEFRTHAGLREALVALGMDTAFDPERADFSRMTAEEPLYIDDVIHEAYIAVDEEGTEAAAATAVIMRATAAPVEIVQLTIDRPFLFALRDSGTGALLFLGRVTDPAGS